MKVQMIREISGGRMGVDWPRPGETIDVPAAEAADLIRQGFASDPKSDEPRLEKAVAPKPTTRKTGLTKKTLSS